MKRGSNRTGRKSTGCYQYGPDGKYIKHWVFTRHAANSLGVHQTAISRSMLNSDYHFSAGYYWYNKYQGETIDIKQGSKKRFVYDVITSGKHMFNEFCRQFPSVDITYDQYKMIIEGINEYYRGHMLETGHIVFLPYGNGKMMVQKNKIKTKVIQGKPTLKAAVDWGASNKAGKIIYHLNDHSDKYTYRYMWFSASSYIQPYNIWKMVMSDESKNKLKEYVKEESGYKDVYRECYSKSTKIKVLQKMNELNAVANG